jgi:hypothetical protein
MQQKMTFRTEDEPMNDDMIAKMKPRHVPKPGLIRGAIVDALALVGFFALGYAFLRVTGVW